MSLQSELTRLQANATSISSSKDDIMTALASKGVTVPAGATLHDVPNLIGQIDGMGPIGYVAIGGRTYKTVKIGTQEWLAENLDYKFDVNGSQIPIGQSGTPSIPSAWYCDNDEANYGIDGTYKCGLLYNWYAAKYLDVNKSILLPEGWHVPTNDEWLTLINTIGGADNAGTKLKAANVDRSPSWNGTDDYGFDALPSGYYDGSFHALISNAYFWTSVETSNDYAYRCYLGIVSSLYLNDYIKTHGYSIRLVKDLT